MRPPSLRCILLALPLLGIFAGGGALPVRVFNTENGLPHNRVNRIHLDSKGFLWICTDDGLSRFDGHQFVNYTTANGLPHIHVNALLETRAGEYWVATDGGISRFDPTPGRKRFTNYAPPGSVEANYVNVLTEEQDGALLLGTNSGLYRFRTQHFPPTFEPIDYGAPAKIPDAAKIHMIARDVQHRLWLATEYGLYCRQKDADWMHFGTKNGLPDNFAFWLANEKDRLWVGFRGGFGRITADPKPESPVLDLVRTTKDGLPATDVRVMRFAGNGRRWLATDRGLVEWISDSGGPSSFRAYTMDEGLPVEEIHSLVEDAVGNLWIGTRRRGLLRVGWSRFQTFGASEGLQLGSDQILLETQSGEVRIGDIGARGMRVYCHKEGRFTPVFPALPQPVLASIPHWLQMALEDHKGAWWLSTSLGLFRFPTLGGRPDLRLLSQCHVDRFFEDAAGDLWISLSCPGQSLHRLARWERTTARVQDETERLPPAARTAGIAAFAQDPAGLLWIGLERPGGLFRLRDGRFQPIAADVRGHINKLFQDSRARLWIASTESGLGRIDHPTSDDPKVCLYSRAEGLSGQEVWSVTEDRFGRVYAGTAQGVDRLDPDSGRFVHYSTADGLVRGDIRSALRDRDGDLWFVSANGVSRFTPGEDRASAASPTRITGIRIGGASVALSEFGETRFGPVEFPSHRNSLQVDFTATSYYLPAPLRYQFRLDDGSPDSETETWQDAGKNPTVHLANLASGRYSFNVRALATDGEPGAPATFAFTILQPIWRRWWFQLACALALAALAYAMHVYRLRQQLAIERVRSRIATDLHDDIGASLSRISVIGEAARSRLQGGDSDMERMLSDIADSSRRLVGDMADVVWSLDPRRDQIGDLTSRLRAFGSDLLERRGMEWTVEAPAESLQRGVPPDVRRELYLVLKEGIHNIGKHSAARKAALHLRFEDGCLYGELVDDGRGMASDLRNGAGIPSMRSRVERLGGSFIMSAGAEGGTLIRIRVPLSGTHDHALA